MTTQPRSLPLVALALVVVVLVVQARVVVGGKTWDDVRYHTDVAPPRLAAAAAVQGGALPAWWDGTALGVPLASEPSHGAMYPPLWLASTPRALDLAIVLHLAWAALGVALWARRRASDPGALVAAVLAVTTGVLASAAVRGSLPALAHLPWIGAVATQLGAAVEARARARAAAQLGILLGAVALVGEAAVLFDALVLACALAARRETVRWLAAAIAGGLCVGAAQWVPAAIQLASGAGAGAHAAGLPAARLVELIVPGAFGSGDPARAIGALAGSAPWAPSLFVGAPLLALAAVRRPARRVLVAIAVFAVAAIATGRGGMPAWLGAPELHVGALALVLAVSAAEGLDALAAAERRAAIALGVGAGCTVLALGALGALRAQQPDLAPAIDRALLHGGLGVACMAGAIALAWRSPGQRLALAFALLVAPGVGAGPGVSPVVDRAIVAEAPAWARLADGIAPPVRAFRPVFMQDHPTVEDAIATFAGASAARWGIAAARSEDPARPAVHDQVWLAAARGGGVLLDRFGVQLAILPTTLVGPRKLKELGRRAGSALVELPVAPAAAVVRGSLWSVEPADALNLLFDPGGGAGTPRNTIVLRGTGESHLATGEPRACAIDAWRAGDIALACTADAPGYAVISSTAAAGWSVTVDGADAAWLTADVMRRAVPIAPGAHAVRWTYAAPGLRAGALASIVGLLGLVALWAGARRGRGRGIVAS